jgi:hypothetical protein
MCTKELHEEMVSLNYSTTGFQELVFFYQALGESCPPDAAVMHNVFALF